MRHPCRHRKFDRDILEAVRGYKLVTALHCMQPGIGDRKAVCLVARPSNACIVTKRKHLEKSSIMTGSRLRASQTNNFSTTSSLGPQPVRGNVNGFADSFRSETFVIRAHRSWVLRSKRSVSRWASLASCRISDAWSLQLRIDVDGERQAPSVQCRRQPCNSAHLRQAISYSCTVHAVVRR